MLGGYGGHYAKGEGGVDRALTGVLRYLIKGVWLLTVTAFLGCVVWLAVSLHQQHVQTHDIGLTVAFFFVMGGLPIAIWEIGMHLQYYTRPELQKFIIRILWMVPLYATNSWLALCFTRHAIYFNTFRGCYEAYVIYSFYMYLVTFLGDLHGEDQIIDLLERKQEMEHEHLFPFCWLPKTRMGEPFLNMCRRGAHLYVFVRLVTALVALPLEWAGLYGDGEINFDKGYIYLSTLNNGAAVWAMYCLYVFYRKLKTELAPIRPVPKFMCVKLVVFFSYWQGFMLAMLAWNGALHKTDFTDSNLRVKDIQTGVQNFLICCEMFFAAIAHHWAFSYRDFVPTEAGAAAVRKTTWCDMVWVMLDMEDITRGLEGELPSEMGASAQAQIDEHARLLQKAAEDRPTLRWALQNCFGDRFKEKESPGVPEGVQRQIPEDYGHDHNQWQDAP